MPPPTPALRLSDFVSCHQDSQQAADVARQLQHQFGFCTPLAQRPDQQGQDARRRDPHIPQNCFANVIGLCGICVSVCLCVCVSVCLCLSVILCVCVQSSISGIYK